MQSIESLKPVSELGAKKPHGTRLRYMSGCKCMLCRAANSNYEVKRSAARRHGEWNGLVLADKAQKHIAKLSKKGIGYKSVAEITGIAYSTIFKIKSGERKNLRAENEKKILAVSVEAVNDATKIPAIKTWKQIEWLLEEGFSKAELARRLGYKTPAIQINRNRVTAKTALKVERFYNLMRLGEEEQFYEDNLENFTQIVG